MSNKKIPQALLEDIALPHKGAIKIGPFGSQLRKEELVEKGYKVYGQENVINNNWYLGERRINQSKFFSLKSCQLFSGDLVITMMGTIGKCSIFPENTEVGIMDSHLLRIQVNPNVADNNFVAKILSSPEIIDRQINRMSHGSIMSGLSSKIIRKIRIPLPALSLQCKIVEILDTMDEAIAKTEECIAKLKKIKAGLVHDLLTRGIDENGELRDPVRHPEQFKQSAIGLISREWAVMKLNDLAQLITSGSRGWADYYADQGAIFIRIGNLTREHLNLRLENLIYVQPPKNGEGSRTKVKAGDLLISITADLGIIGVIPSNLDEAYVNQHIALIRLDETIVDSKWVGYFLAGETGQTIFYKLNDSGAKAGLNLPTVSSLLVPIPDISEQERIVSRISDIETSISKEEAYLEKLKLQKKGLMHDLLTGKVRVKHL